MSVLIIDNNDSFTYNLAQSVQKINGIELSVINYQDIADEDWRKADKIIISPGPGLPEDFPMYRKWLEAYADKKNILGICMGQEIIARHFGGELEQLKHVQHGIRKEISIDNTNALFNDLEAKIKVGLYHSWVVSKEFFPDSLKLIAQDKSGMIMGIAHKTYKIWAVQFHPESFMTDPGDQIIANFIHY